MAWKDCLKIVKPLLPVLPTILLKHQNTTGTILMMYWWYKKVAPGSNGLKNTMFKKADEKICYKRISLYNNCLWFLVSFDIC